MWNTDTPWFEVAMVTSLLTVGNILFGHFEEHKAKWRRLLKVALFAGATAGFASFGLRWVGWAFIGMAIIGAGDIHLRWLPSHGINGWTGEPKKKYFELIDATRGRHPKLRASPALLPAVEVSLRLGQALEAEALRPGSLIADPRNNHTDA